MGISIDGSTLKQVFLCILLCRRKPHRSPMHGAWGKLQILSEKLSNFRFDCKLFAQFEIPPKSACFFGRLRRKREISISNKRKFRIARSRTELPGRCSTIFFCVKSMLSSCRSRAIRLMSTLSNQFQGEISRRCSGFDRSSFGCKVSIDEDDRFVDRWMINSISFQTS